MDMKISLYMRAHTRTHTHTHTHTHTQYNFQLMMTSQVETYSEQQQKKYCNKMIGVLAELFFSVLRNGSAVQWVESKLEVAERLRGTDQWLGVQHEKSVEL